ncbi:hypothetical protein [Chryseobacterium oryzae]|uniref:Uncharacterized protein n=1 Tax=Chryseobacterium oryzae TaxID=2929799 RepID=A0ABY4BJG6_9FLAO|nr:hypothetical protein [Chryseobacterium oryzae]UOE38924.1 hypothetical protein MTP08_03890 [Chryseobacterium oryzae]
MKKLYISLLISVSAISFAQKVSDYQYISVPENFKSFKKQNYGLSKVISQNLKFKKYIILSENRGEWPSEANSNPCNVLDVDVLNDSGFLRNKVVVEFKDCNSKVIASQKGSSSIKEFEEGFQDALKQALLTIPTANPKEILNQNPAKEESKQVYLKEATIQKPENIRENSGKYGNGKIVLQKIQLDDHQFILVENNSSVPFATFKSTTKKDNFKVKLKSGENTFGYFENGTIVIEIPKGNEEYSKEVFSEIK